MASLYNQLEHTDRVGRRAMAERLITNMRTPGNAASLAYWGLCKEVMRRMGVDTEGHDPSLQRGEFTAGESAYLLFAQYRVLSFLNAVGNAAAVGNGTIIDAGTGASAILAVGAAIMHPHARVIAYEVNQSAARCANTVVDLLGLRSKIEVRHADVLTEKLPIATLGVTETFSGALLEEPGHKITAALAQVAEHILPNSAVIYANDNGGTPYEQWQKAAVIDLRQQNSTVTGRLRSSGGGVRFVSAYTILYDEHVPIMGEVAMDTITTPVELGPIAVRKAGTRIDFSYALGAEAVDPIATFHVGNNPGKSKS